MKKIIMIFLKGHSLILDIINKRELLTIESQFNEKHFRSNII